MGQSEILSDLQLLLFKDTILKNLLALPDTTKLVAFRDKYCIAGYNASELVDNTIKSRLVISWAKTTSLSNPETAIRTLCFDIYVQKDIVYTASERSALVRRQDLIQRRIKQLLHNQRVAGFKFKCTGLNDALSSNTDYAKAFILFDVKYIF